MNSVIQPLIAPSRLRFSDSNLAIDIWRDLKPVKVEIYSSAAGATKPIGTKDLTYAQAYSESLSVDIKTTKIIQPPRLRVNVLAANLSTVEDIVKRFQDNTTALTVTSRGIIAVNMVPLTIVIEQSSEMLNCANIEMEFEQFAPYNQDTYDPADDANNNVFGVKVQQLDEVSDDSLRSAVNSLTSSVANLYNSLFPSL